MKPRLPTAEEKRQWRESNRFTTVKPGMEANPADEASPNIPPAGGGKLGGRSTGHTRSVGVADSDPPPQPSPACGGGSKPPLRLLSTREAKRVLASAPPVEATLDLHGLTKLEAHGRVEGFITRQARAGKRHVAIITGKGRDGVGVLRRYVPEWLNEAPLRPLISALAHARPEKGGAGVLHVLLKRRHD